MGSTPVGGPIVGWVGQVIGPRAALVLGGVTAIAAAALAWRSLNRPAADDVELDDLGTEVTAEIERIERLAVVEAELMDAELLQGELVDPELVDDELIEDDELLPLAS